MHTRLSACVFLCFSLYLGIMCVCVSLSVHVDAHYSVHVYVNQIGECVVCFATCNPNSEFEVEMRQDVVMELLEDTAPPQPSW